MEPFRVYIGWDQRDISAFEVCVNSLKEHSSVPVEIFPLKEWELRQRGMYWRAYSVDGKGQMWDERDGKPFSTNFSFTRFCVPLIEREENRRGWCLFCDADMMWRRDIASLLELRSDNLSVMCVKHDYRPEEGTKMDGVIQTRYKRKNWSSLMLMNSARKTDISPYRVNNASGSELHQLTWVQDDEIGALPETWNWLEGWSDPNLQPDLVHFTRGTPDMIGECMYSDEWWSYLDKKTRSVAA